MSLGRSQTAFPHNYGTLKTANNFGAQFAEHAQQYSTGSFGLPLPPGGERYKDHKLAMWMPFFGVNPKVYSKPPEFDYQREVLNMPEGFKGQCDHIDTILINRITKADKWPINEALPMKENNNSLSTIVQRIQFNDHLLSRTPEQAPSRLLTQQFDEKTMTMVRYGLAMMLEHGFMRTPRGIATYFANLQQIYNATLETLMLGAQEAILYVDRSGWNANSMGQVRTKDALLRAEQREMRFFGITQKTEHGWYLALDDVKEEFQKVNGTPGDYLIVGQGVMKYANSSNNNTGMYLMGQRGSSASDRTERARNGITVREFRPARIDVNQADLDISKINTVIGGYVPVKMDHLRNVPPEEWKTQYMNVQAHDEDADDYFWINYAQMHTICPLFRRNRGSTRQRNGFFGGNFTQRQGDPNAEAGQEQRWSLTQRGHQFFEGCSSWGEYMKQHGLLNPWIRSFLVKPLEVQSVLLNDIARVPFPKGSDSLRAGVVADDDDAEGVLYSTPKAMARLADLMRQQVAQQHGGGGGGGGDGDDIKETLANRHKQQLRAILQQMFEGGAAGQKYYARIMITVLAGDPQTSRDAWVAFDPPGIAEFVDTTEALARLQSDLNQLYRIGEPVPVALLPERPIFYRPTSDDKLKRSVRVVTDNDQLVYSMQSLLGALASGLPKPVTDLWGHDLNPSTFVMANPAQSLFTGVVNLPAYAKDVKNVKVDIKPKIKAIADAMKILLNRVGDGKDVVPALVAGKLSALEFKKLDLTAHEAKRTGRGRGTAMPAKVVKLLRGGEEKKKAHPFFERHKDSLDAIYSRHHPGSSDQGKFNSDEEFVRLIAALEKAELALLDDKEKELAVTLFLNDLYFAVVEVIPKKLRNNGLLGGQSEDALVAAVRGALARLYVLYTDVGSDILQILADMHQNSLATLAKHMENESEGSMTDQEARLDSLTRAERKAGLAELKAGDAKQKAKWKAAEVQDLLYAIPITNPDIVFWSLENDCWPLIFFNVLAPSIEYITSPMVLMGGWGAAGNTMHGQHSFELGDDATLKYHFGHFTLYAQAMIFDDRRICTRHHVFVHDYVRRSNGQGFWNPHDEQDVQDWNNGIHSKARIVQPYYPDDQDANSATRINITGYEHPDVRAASDRPLPSTAEITADTWGFKHSLKPNIDKPYIEAMHDYSTVCYRSHYRGCKYLGNGRFDETGTVYIDKGHWGENNGYPGCGGVRNGKRMWMERPDFSAVSLRTNVISSGTAAGI